MKFDKTLHRTARIRTVTHPGGHIDEGRTYTVDSGGEIYINSSELPSIKDGADKWMNVQGSSAPFSEGHSAVTVLQPEITAYSPDILLADGSFDYSRWDDGGYWEELLINRTLKAQEEQLVQIKLKEDGDYTDKGINLYYVTLDYVSQPSRWVPLETDKKSGFSNLVIASGGAYLKTKEEFRLMLPGPGTYVLIARYASADEKLPDDFIDADEYNKKDEWSFLVMKCL